MRHVTFTMLLLIGLISNLFAQGVWTKRVSGTTNGLLSVTWGGNQLVAVGQGGTILTSPSGVNWTARISGIADSLSLCSVTWTGNQLVAVGAHGTILTSQDGISWTIRSSGTTGNLNSVIWTGSQLVAVGKTNLPQPNDSGIVIMSPDGVNWTSRAFGTAGGLYSVSWTGNQLVAVGHTYSVSGNVRAIRGLIVTSPNGVTWTTQATGISGYMSFVAWIGNELIALSRLGNILTSPNGVNWTSRTSGTTQSLFSVVSTGSLFVTVGLSGTVINSLDGATWMARTSGVVNDLYSITWTGTQFVAVGTGGAILTSPREVTPAAPTLTAPGQNAINISTAPTLTWNDLPEAASYRLQVSTNSSFTTTLVNDSTITTTARVIGPLVTNTVYYWQVNAKNTAGISTYSPIWSFTTAGVVAPPLTPTLSSPPSPCGCEYVSNLIWNSSIGATSYQVQLSTDSTFSTTVINDSTLTTTTRSIGGQLTAHTWSYWRVRAKNTSGVSTYSTVWSFRMDPLAVSPQDLTHQHLSIENGKILRFFLPQRTQVVIKLVDPQGRMVSQLLNETRDAGSNTLPLTGLKNSYDLLDFRAGDYHRTMKIHP